MTLLSSTSGLHRPYLARVSHLLYTCFRCPLGELCPMSLPVDLGEGVILLLRCLAEVWQWDGV
jgi:hypothetical protein